MSSTENVATFNRSPVGGTPPSSEPPVAPEVRAAIRAMYTSLGVPRRGPLPFDADASGDDVTLLELHPVFRLAEHHLSADSYNGGWTYNRHRGDHLTIPAYTERGDVCALEISFHKGTAAVEYLIYACEPADVHGALYDLLISLETR